MATQKPDLTRVWANGAPPANVVDPDTTTPGKVNAGWQAEVPPFEHFNFLQKWFTQGLAHFNEQGVGVWDTDTTYPINGLAKGSDGNIYKAILEQSGNDPVSDGGTNWVIFGDIDSSNITDYTDLIFDSVSSAILAVTNGDAPIGSKLRVEDYYGGLTPNNSGVLFFKVVAPGTGVSDGGKYIDAGAFQLEQSIGSIPTVEKWGAVGDGVADDTGSITACLSANGYAILTNSNYNITTDISGRCIAFGLPTVTGGRLSIYDISAEYAHPGGRDTIRYKSAQEVTISANEMIMGGFRFLGSYKNRTARVFKTPSLDNAVSLISNLGAETTKAINNWYAVFAVANEGDFECSFVLIPYLHLGSPISPGRFRTLEGGDNTYDPNDTSDLKSYDWGVGVDGSDCLIITENGAFSGRVTTITGGGTTPGSNSITIADAGSVSKNDWILPAPKNYDFYRYCGSFFHDTAEVRNIADTGYYIGSRGAELQELPDKGYDSGSQTNVELNPLGNICPLACGIRFVSVSSFSTSGTGSYAETFATDSSLHVADQFQTHKTSGSTETIGTHGIEVPFSFKPSFFFSNSGTIAPSRLLGQMLPWGWYER